MRILATMSLFCLFSSACFAKKDSLFLKPNILIEYERGPWEGPSGGERKYRKDNNYNRFCNEHYLYPGWSPHVDIERNWLLYNEININSGYLDELPVANVRHSPTISEREYYHFIRYSEEDIFNPNAFEINKEIRTINGYNYEFRSLRELVFGLTGEKITWHYFRTATLDTLFSDGTFLRIYTETNDGGFNFLEKRVQKLLHIQRIPTHVLDSIQQMHFNRKNLHEALDTIYSRWKKDFIHFEEKQLSCTSADILYPMVMNQMSMESVVSLLSDFRYKDLADSILRIHHDFLFDAGNRLLTLQKEYNYSITKELAYYQMINQGRAPLSDFLNYMSKDSVYTFLDTLDMYQTIREFTAYNLQRYMEQHDQLLFEDEISGRFYSDVENELCRQFAFQYLNHKDDKLLFSRKVSESKSRKIFLISFDDFSFSAPVLVVFTRQKDKSWKTYHRQLQFNPTIDGKSGMFSLKSYLIVPAEFQCMVLDSREAKTDVQILEMDSTGWGDYRQILVAHKTMTDSPFDMGLRDLHKNAQTNEKTQQNERSYYPKTIRYPVIRPSQPQSVVDEYASFARKPELKPEEVLIYQPFVLVDINQTGTSEIVSYTLCAGQCLQLKCYSADDGELKEIEKSIALNWLQHDDQFQNLLNYSIMGNRNTTKSASN